MTYTCVRYFLSNLLDTQLDRLYSVFLVYPRGIFKEYVKTFWGHFVRTGTPTA